jgi:hypothetical protein
MTSTFRSQRKNQNARQATMISGLSTIYRNQSITHSIQTHQQTEPRIFLLDTTLEEMNQMYSKIHGMIEKGRLRPKGTEVFFVYKKRETLIISEDAIYEITYASRTRSTHLRTHANNNDMITREVVNPRLLERIPVDGEVTTIELNIVSNDETGKPHKSFVVPLLVDESYYKLTNRNMEADATTITGSHISPNHTLIQYTKIVVKLHPKSMNSFVFIMDENENEVLDFYFTTENGIIEKNKDKLTKTCKDDIISFIDHFKLCS